jgi:hypothetical protein
MACYLVTRETSFQKINHVIITQSPKEEFGISSKTALGQQKISKDWQDSVLPPLFSEFVAVVLLLCLQCRLWVVGQHRSIAAWQPKKAIAK